MKLNSLSFRLFISASFVLAAFFALVAFVLERSYQEGAAEALKEKLKVHTYSLLSAAELTEKGILKIPTLSEPRYSNPSSGLYAAIHLTNKFLLWRSKSALGVNLSNFKSLKPGEYAFVNDNEGHFILHYAVIWENETGLEQYYVFSVAEDDSFVSAQIVKFRLTLRSWLFFIGILLAWVQYLVLRWSLKPLRDIVDDLEAIEKGEETCLEREYPIELAGLANNLNTLIDSERAHLQRYRNTLANLAHSLKTPLAILSGCILPEKVNKVTVAEQILRMNEIVEYQLQKAAAQGEKQLSSRVDILSIVEKIIFSLEKVYFDKGINFSFDVKDDGLMSCEEGDIYEIAGNLLDNAAKWCDKEIRINLVRLDKKQGERFSLMLQIEDDGGGIEEEKLQVILQRGIRADENVKGHGIGMAVVSELTGLLGGKLKGGRSESLGGMKWQVYFP